MQTSSKRSSERGSALLTVLWLTAALAAVGAAVASNVRGETERTSTAMDETKSYFIARGAIERAALHMLWRAYLDDSAHPIYFQPGQPRIDLDFPEAQATVEVIPATSKLNVNTITPEDLLRLLTALHVPLAEATELTAAIVDWRTPPDPLHASPFDAFYLGQSPSFLPRHASYQEDDELLLTKGMTPELYYGNSLGNSHAGLRDCLSVYGSGYSVDINTAQPATLLAAGLSPDDVDSIVERRAAQPWLDYRDFARVVQALGPSGQRLMLGGRSIYTLRATARLKRQDGKLSDLRRTVAALVQFNMPGNSRKKPTGVEVLRWFDRS
jgi:general secretion pathway protein K